MLNGKPLDYSLLAQLTQSYGPSGFEENVAELIARHVRPLCDSVTLDSMGNLIAVRRGQGKRIMVAAHMDEIGIMITHIDPNGFLRFTPIGGVRVNELLHRRVQFKNGRYGTIGVEKLDKPTDLKLERLFIDIGVANQAEAEEIVKIGDSAVFVGEFQRCGNRIISKALDDRIGCFIAIEALKRCQSAHELAFVFTVQEEVGTRGAQTSAYHIAPDLAVSVDVTSTGDTPKAHYMNVSLGKGPAIKVLDRSMVTSPAIKRWMAKTAEAHRIPYQWEVLEYGGTDSGAIHLTKGGIPSGVLSIPTRYIHSPSEMADQSDIENAVRLLVHLLESPPEN